MGSNSILCSVASTPLPVGGNDIRWRVASNASRYKKTWRAGGGGREIWLTNFEGEFQIFGGEFPSPQKRLDATLILWIKLRTKGVVFWGRIPSCTLVRML
jgi:hypothetical protein